MLLDVLKTLDKKFKVKNLYVVYSTHKNIKKKNFFNIKFINCLTLVNKTHT